MKHNPGRQSQRSGTLLVSPPIHKRSTKIYTTVFLQRAGKRQQQAIMAANSISTPACRLFITYRASKPKFLVDTGSDLCVFPRKLVPGRKGSADYDLFEANGMPTHIYEESSSLSNSCFDWISPGASS
jgi:hypothetical protein